MNILSPLSALKYELIIFICCMILSLDLIRLIFIDLKVCE